MNKEKPNEYKKPYLILFGYLEDILKALENQNYGIAEELIVKAQLEAEEAFVSFGENL